MKAVRIVHPAMTVPALAGFAILGANAVLCVFAGLVAPHGAGDIVGAVWAPPGPGAWLGSDQLGRDILSRMIYGAQVTIGAALAASVVSYVIGCLLGTLAALAGGWVDTAISRLVDVMLAIPTLIFALAVLTVFPGTVALVATIGVLMAPRVFRIVRALALQIVSLDYIEVARLRGEGTAWIILHEVIPNALPGLAAEFGLRICFSVLFISSLSFLGFGVEPPAVDWGTMVRENAIVIGFGGWAPLFPAAAIALLTIATNLVVDWLLSVTGGRAAAR